MSKFTSTGCTIGLVASSPATEDEAGYAALSYVQIGETTNIPQFGPTVAVVESNPLESGIVEKFKGFINNGSTSVDFDVDPTDAGQILVGDGVTGADKDTRHSFKIEYSSGDIRYFQGKIFSNSETPGSANSMVSGTAQIEIETNVLKVAAP